MNLETLEDRITPSTVINVNDPGGGMDNPANVTVATLGSNVTLRDAINAADNTGGSGSYLINLPALKTITFTSPVKSGWHRRVRRTVAIGAEAPKVPSVLR